MSKPTIHVVAKLAPNNTPYEATIANDGSFALRDLPFGAYAVTADDGPPVSVNITNTETVHVELPLH